MDLPIFPKLYEALSKSIIGGDVMELEQEIEIIKKAIQKGRWKLARDRAKHLFKMLDQKSKAQKVYNKIEVWVDFNK